MLKFGPCDLMTIVVGRWTLLDDAQQKTAVARIIKITAEAIHAGLKNALTWKVLSVGDVTYARYEIAIAWEVLIAAEVMEPGQEIALAQEVQITVEAVLAEQNTALAQVVLMTAQQWIALTWKVLIGRYNI